MGECLFAWAVWTFYSLMHEEGASSKAAVNAYTAAVGMDMLAALRSSGFHCLGLLPSYFVVFPFSLLYNMTYRTSLPPQERGRIQQGQFSLGVHIWFEPNMLVFDFYCSVEWQDRRILGFEDFFSFLCCFSTEG